jgi:hypothetical protein
MDAEPGIVETDDGFSYAERAHTGTSRASAAEKKRRLMVMES